MQYGPLVLNEFAVPPVKAPSRGAASVEGDQYSTDVSDRQIAIRHRALELAGGVGDAVVAGV